MRGSRFANDMAACRQTVLSEHLQHLIALVGSHLDDHTKFFVEQRLQGFLFATGADLLPPIFAVPMIGFAVGHAIAFGHKHVQGQHHTDMTRERHLSHTSPQAAVASVVVSKNPILFSQNLDR